jgi:hypothetical protein
VLVKMVEAQVALSLTDASGLKTATIVLWLKDLYSTRQSELLC